MRNIRFLPYNKQEYFLALSSVELIRSSESGVDSRSLTSGSLGSMLVERRKRSRCVECLPTINESDSIFMI